MWDAIVITCSDQELAFAFEKEFFARQSDGLIDNKTTVLSVVDPKPNIGSGGATINAIVNVTEHISALEGYTVITSDVLKNKKLLILHLGTTYPYSACSPGFFQLPATFSKSSRDDCTNMPLTQIDFLLHMTVNKLAVNSPAGIWVCSCDRLLKISPETKIDWSSGCEVHLFTVPVDVDVAVSQHGAVKLDEQNVVDDIIYKGDEERITSCILDSGKVPVVSGIVFFTTSFIEKMLNVSVRQPLVSYTYLGIDSAPESSKQRPMASEVKDVYRLHNTNNLLSLYFDVLLCMASSLTMEDFVHGHRSGVYGTVHFPDLETIDITLRNNCREVLWETFNDISMKGEILTKGEFSYLSHSPSILRDIIIEYSNRDEIVNDNNVVKFTRNVTSLMLNVENDNDVISVNSYTPHVKFGKNSIIFNCLIENNVTIGENCLFMNISTEDLQRVDRFDERTVHVPNDLVMESLYLNLGSDSLSSVNKVLIMFGVHDLMQESVDMPGSTIFNQTWKSFFDRTQILPHELWLPDLPEKNRCLLNARLFPVFCPKNKIDVAVLFWMQGSVLGKNMVNVWRSCWRLSILEILNICDAKEEFLWRKRLHFEIGKRELKKSLLDKLPVQFLHFFKTCIADGYFEDILESLDQVAALSNDTSVIGRTFACIADVLGIKAGNKGGLRSGPAGNILWKEGHKLLETGRVKDAVAYFASERKSWYARPDLLVRAARHYEGAFQLQVRKAVSTARQFIVLTKGTPVGMNTWVTAEAPGRLDFAGGWSDTPPISYENGGKVLSVALSIDNKHGGAVVMLTTVIDGKKPIGCRVKRIPETKIVLLLGKENPMIIECSKFNDLLNYGSPNSPGALLKAAFFCADLLPAEPYSSQKSLAEHLQETYNSGFMLQTWSNLPQGSGLGTSSILAGCILSALWTVAGMKHEISSVLHAVLDLEQMLTTGGGWQDQVGGLCPGVKLATSENRLPLEIKVVPVDVPKGFLKTLAKHLLVVFTGKTRLARNMLQDVLRNWNARSAEIVQTANDLVNNANETLKAFTSGDLEKLGHCINWCWTNKKKMAHGCEPTFCKDIMDILYPHVHGISLAGAGGGGFMYMITKEEYAMQFIKTQIEKVEGAHKATIHEVSIDEEGLVVRIGD